MRVKTPLVTKAEALEMLIKHIDKPGVIDVPDLIELLKWQTKLTLWVLQEHNSENKRQQVNNNGRNNQAS